MVLPSFLRPLSKALAVSLLCIESDVLRELIDDFAQLKCRRIGDL